MKRGITLIMIAVLVIAAGLGALSVSRNAKSTREFVADGYILKPSADEIVTTDVDEQYYFAQGAKYKEKYATKVLFKDRGGEEVSLDVNQFIHYADGSLGSFTKGVIMNLSDLTEEQFGYYSLTKNTILVKNGSAYEMSSRGEAMELSEYIWKLSDTDYMIVSPEVTLHLNDSTDITLPEYAQIKYVDSGIVRIVHQQGTYQTVSADTVLRTQSGAELNLVGKNFYVNGEPALSLDSMSIDDESYIELDENTDTPELKLPTFNVINGKDGTSGKDGTNGEKGEEGQEGVVGQDGEEGVAGSEGAQGSEGAAGMDGVEGDSGIMGYDGAEGANGKSAKNANQSTGIVTADLLARPTLNIDAKDSEYNVTAGSAEMQINMNDNDNSLIRNKDTTRVIVYNRATMEPVNSKEQQIEAGRRLENNGSYLLQMKNLSQNTEYVVVVSGTYSVDSSDAVGVVGNLFTKIFKTDSLGITIEKSQVTESMVSAKTVVTADNVDSYKVEFFTYNEDGTEKQLALYDSLTTDGEFVFSDTQPSGTLRKVGSEYKVKSNTSYYVRIADVLLTDGKLVNTGDTTIELKTLKQTPFKQKANEADPTELITSMQPDLTSNLQNRTLILSLAPVSDPDNGVTGYRYELYNEKDVTDAGTNLTTNPNAYADLTPVYKKESTTLETQTFSIPEGDKNTYVAKVVALFNDNEKDVEYTTLFSDESGFGDKSYKLKVEFLQVNQTAQNGAHHDMLDGYIKVTDPENKMLINFLNTSTPLTLTITGQYSDVYKIEYYNTTDKEVTYDAAGGYYLFPFKQDGLHADGTYTLVVHGPCDSDSTPGLADAEKQTYLAGLRGLTPGTVPLSMVSYDLHVATAAFARGIHLTNSPLLAEPNTIPVDYYQYEAQTLDSMTLELYHVEGNVQELMGETTLVDTNTLHQTSDFGSNSWISRSDASKDASNGTLTIDSTQALTTNAYEVTPSSFGLQDYDSRFYSGGTFEIRVKQDTAVDYAGNIIPFADGEDKMVFTIEKKHVPATDPNNQVEASIITQGAARDGYGDNTLDEDTPVGIRFKADYAYQDVETIYYYIYELTSDAPTNSILDGTESNPSMVITPSNFASFSKLVLQGKKTLGQGAGYKTENVELYFDKTKCNMANYNWKNAEGADVEGSETVLERGKRYIIRYEVDSNWAAQGLDCDGGHDNDHYPNCAYGGSVETNLIPFYRSKVIELSKQVPAIQRYQYSSTDNDVTWKYKIVDPDKAFIQTNDGHATFVISKYANSVNAVSNTGAVTVEKDTRLADYVNYDDYVIGMSDNCWYTVRANYKLSSTDTEKSIISTPVPFRKLQSAPTGISAKGLKATDITPDENKVGTLEQALINEGGYRYRLTLQGNDIAKYNALQIDVYGDYNDNGSTKTKHVYYDPVYYSYVDTADGVPYAYVYLDTAPLEELNTAGVTTAQVDIYGYYSTNMTGIADYQSQKNDYTSDLNLEGENLYALKKVGSNGSETYQTLNLQTGNLTNTTQNRMNGSFFIPNDGIGNGFDTSSDGSGSLKIRYPSDSLSMTSGTVDYSKNISLIFDENGMRDSTAAAADYYIVEKLAKNSTKISFSTSGDSSYFINISDIMPAVEKNRINTGATSAYLKMQAMGTGKSDQNKIYAYLYEVNGNNKSLLKINQQTVGAGADLTTYYQALDAGTEDDYQTDDFKSKSIPIITEVNAQNGQDIFAELRIRGLKPNTKYQAVFFSYDKNGGIQKLYSIDGNRAGYEYEFTTLNNVTIEIGAPSYTYGSYSNKTAQFRFGIPGDEGSGKTIHYELYKNNEASGTKVTMGDIEKLGNTNQYYSQYMTENKPVSLTMNPNSSTNLEMNTEYTLKLYATDDTDSNSIIGTATKTFTTPASLADPTFQVQTTQSSAANDSSTLIRVSVTSTDKQKSITNSQYTVALYEKTSDESNPYIQKGEASTLTHSGDTSTNVSQFMGENGKEYKVVITANIDNSNTGATSHTIIREYIVTTSTDTRATVAFSVDKTDNRTATIRLSNFQNFSQVNGILITIFNENHESVYYGSLEQPSSGSFADESGTSAIIRQVQLNTTATNGWYDIQAQFSKDGTVLGNATGATQLSGIPESRLFALQSRSLSLMSIAPSVTPEPSQEATTEATETTVTPTNASSQNAAVSPTPTTVPTEEPTATPTAASSSETSTSASTEDDN